MPIRKATAIWNGDLLKGDGTLKTETGTVNSKYSFTSRFEEGVGTNPEELIAAAHAGCFSMALSGGLAKAGFTEIKITTEDKVYIEKGSDGFSITKIEVFTEVEAQGIDEAKFQEIADATKKSCPVSRVLTGTEIILHAKLKV
ncbi:MAG: OsmC family peroxiredoxin [Ignavibacteriales bacterium]|nr:OsmC family peroxiredoxin [Ignavibacteriales bacterium]